MVSEPTTRSERLISAVSRRLRFRAKLFRALEAPLPGLVAALLFGGIVSLARGLDASWDLRNYHFYNPWAWLNNRLYYDYAPAQIQSYLNPLPDLPYYALVRAEVPAPVIAFVMRRVTVRRSALFIS